MNIVIASNALICICGFIGFFYGMDRFFKPRKAVYAQMITLSAGCMAFGRLYQVIRILTIGSDMYEHFQLGFLGLIGSLLFLFSANFGVMDSLADDGSKKYQKYRLIPLAAPLVAILNFVIFTLLRDLPMVLNVEFLATTLVVGCASYFNLKHLIFPDVDFGVINCLKGYNALALAMEFLSLAEMDSIALNRTFPFPFIGFLMGIVIIAIPIVVERGIKKWST